MKQTPDGKCSYCKQRQPTDTPCVACPSRKAEESVEPRLEAVCEAPTVPLQTPAGYTSARECLSGKYGQAGVVVYEEYTAPAPVNDAHRLTWGTSDSIDTAICKRDTPRVIASCISVNVNAHAHCPVTAEAIVGIIVYRPKSPDFDMSKLQTIPSLASGWGGILKRVQ